MLSIFSIRRCRGMVSKALLIYVYCNYDGSGRRFGMIEAFENCLRHVCEEGVCGV